jgi:hypothetical protein
MKNGGRGWRIMELFSIAVGWVRRAVGKERFGYGSAVEAGQGDEVG